MVERTDGTRHISKEHEYNTAMRSIRPIDNVKGLEVDIYQWPVRMDGSKTGRGCAFQRVRRVRTTENEGAYLRVKHVLIKGNEGRIREQEVEVFQSLALAWTSELKPSCCRLTHQEKGLHFVFHSRCRGIDIQN